MEKQELRKRNEAFIRKVREEDPFYFDELKKGQTLEFFYAFLQ